MTIQRRNIFRLMKDIQEDAKDVDEYNTGLFGEHVIVASYNRMTLENLEKIRVIINGIIKKKKEFKRVQDAKQSQTPPIAPS